jgi:3'-phosphoadenosine 5'-phosphosulfate sulfotransferase (PAPS reductase)/FAD synthetase
VQTLAYRDAETYRAYLVDLGQRGIGVAIARPGVPGDVWDGIAVFPRAAAAEAAQRYEELETDVDAEDLLREWSDPDGRTLVDFIGFVAHEPAVEVGELGAVKRDKEDLPQFLIPAEGLVRKLKPKRQVKAKAKAPGKIPLPYVRRAYPGHEETVEDEIKLLPLDKYDHIIVSFSGGKDSVAAVLYLLELGVPPERIELWHQCVDGRPGTDERMWDWPCTESYCESFAKAFGMRLLFQWKEGGFLGEMTKLDRPTAPAAFQLLDGSIMTAGGEGKPGTRLTFPAMSADLMTRWCSAYLKIDVAKKVFTNDPRFADARSLIITGERRQESGNRSRYASATDYGSTRKRTVHQWRAILPWFEQDVWEIMERYRVRPHPAYFLGWSRVSCLPCIFGDPNQWATISEITPKLLKRLAGLEDKFYIAAREIPDHPFAHDPNFNGFLRRGESLPEAAARGQSYPIPYGSKYLKLGLNEHLPEGYALLDRDEKWETPMGAFGHSGGPT